MKKKKLRILYVNYAFVENVFHFQKVNCRIGCMRLYKFRPVVCNISMFLSKVISFLCVVGVLEFFLNIEISTCLHVFIFRLDISLLENAK